jgi:hypothetical protein
MCYPAVSDAAGLCVLLCKLVTQLKSCYAAVLAVRALQLGGVGCCSYVHMDVTAELGQTSACQFVTQFGTKLLAVAGVCRSWKQYKTSVQGRCWCEWFLRCTLFTLSEASVRSSLVGMCGTHKVGELHACCNWLVACMHGLQVLLRFCMASILAGRVVVGDMRGTCGLFLYNVVRALCGPLVLVSLPSVAVVWQSFRKGFSHAAAAVCASTCSGVCLGCLGMSSGVLGEGTQ